MREESTYKVFKLEIKGLRVIGEPERVNGERTGSGRVTGSGFRKLRCPPAP